MKLITRGEEETIKVGEELASKLRPGSVVALYGEMGAGKTCFIKGVCRGLGVREEVTSPSFTLLNLYQGRLLVYHFDFFRIQTPEEAWDIGFEEFIYQDGVSLIEWAEKVRDILPEGRIEVFLKRINKDLREIQIVYESSGNRDIINPVRSGHCR